jgi:hypothetical protein
MHAACSSIGFPTPVSFSPFPTESTVPDRLPSPDLLRNQVHPLVSFAPLCSPPSSCLPAAFRPQAPSMGLHSLIAASPTGVVTAGSHTHRLSVLGVSHALDGFVRRLARGFVSPHSHVQGSLFRGSSLVRSGNTSSMPRALSSVLAESLSPVARLLHDSTRRPQGLVPRPSPVRVVGV